MRLFTLLLLLLVRPPDEYTRACVSLDGTDLYLVQSPNDCYAGDKRVCDAGNFGEGTPVCCAESYAACRFAFFPGSCYATETHFCSAGPA